MCFLWTGRFDRVARAHRVCLRYSAGVAGSGGDDAQALSAAALAARIKELSGKAVEGTISADDLSGGTFTISNLGGLGVDRSRRC